MEDLYISTTTAAATNNNVMDDLPKKKWNGGLTILKEHAVVDECYREDGGKPPILPADDKRRNRRKSWQMGRLDKKRRKSVSVLSPIPDAEQCGLAGSYYKTKRPSWWNIFTADHWPRSRRNSDFAGTTSERIPYKRGKSRSVDHGLTSPFDLDSLRSKVEGRFESVDKLNRDSGTDGESQSSSKERLSERKMHKPPPIATITYKVEASDTLASVAARFDTTPSELAILNRLPSRTVFPGQIIRVPDKKRSSVSESDASQGALSNLDVSETNSSTSAEGESKSGLSTGNDSRDASNRREDDMLDSLRPSSPKSGHQEHTGSSASPSSGRSHTRGVERFLKINVRHITDGQGVVGGVLLVTPNAVMFDPNVSDPLVIEHGPESYGVIAPMEFVVNAAIYYDIAHMRVAGPYQASGHENDNITKPAIYHLPPAPKPEIPEDGEHKSSAMLTTMQTDSLDSATLDLQISPGGRTDSLLAKDETFPELRSSTEDEEEDGSVCSCNARRNDGAAFPKAFDRDLVTPSPMNRSSDALKKSDKESVTENSGNEDDRPLSSLSSEQDGICSIRNMEQRRQSSIDQHWAMPNKVRSLDDEPPVHHEEQPAADESEPSTYLVKQSCHDSGIDIRDPPVLSVPRKTVYSDADILLSESDFIPPVPVVPLSTDHLSDAVNLRKKKSTSVSFSLEDSKEQDTSAPVEVQQKVDEQADKQAQDTKKNKMLKRLSYPLAWMEGFTGDKDSEKEGSSVPSSAESSHLSHSSSVFSKVFSSSPINMVTDFGSGLFLMKTPSEESGRFQFPPAQDCSPAPSSATPPKREGLASFSPSSIINSVGRSSVTTFIRQQQHGSNSRSDSQNSTKTVPPRLDYRSMVSVDDMPELFVSFDKLIPRPVTTFEEPAPLYLRLRMGKPKDKKIPKSTPIMSYGKKKMKPEYWFSVPRNRVDDLYRFLMLWVSHLYGDLDEEVVTGRGFELVESDTELWEEAETPPGDTSDKKLDRNESEAGDLTRESWEVLSMSDELRRAFYANSVNSLDFDSYIPELHGTTEILTEEHRKQLSRHLPARAEGYMWSLVFSTLQHGFSLNSMYRKMSKIESPILLVIQDTQNNVFGALTSCALKMSDHFYGTGESLLYTFCPDFQVYNWTGDNMYFIKGNNESLSIGAGDGKFGLWLDGDLNQGRTEACNTYGNDPLVPEQDFVVKILECWAFL
ncbi:nuclear receptor coactivator 7 isoform X3 [Adelges cooleyi]|uniref:nuclear receptor coactivator 7 isoform X3 n=1 Tax=Adelges cooleyi TaxID=133065 RepID=UPI0021807DEA|nr:nuclear receptor coactivator 7 isoform X3 [Adelges cooleyi]